MPLTRQLLAFIVFFSLTSSAFAGWFSSHHNDTYTQTRYPIVLVNGLFGFDKLMGIDYWYQIPQELRRSGATVYVAQVQATASNRLRGEQLARQVEDILAASGAAKVNLIGHSQGGPTVRYVASVYPDYVASATSVGGVNWGSKVADLITHVQDNDPTGVSKALITTFGNGLASLIDLLSNKGGYPQNVQAALHALTTPATIAFNQQYPEGMPTHYCGQGHKIGSNGVYYFSWGGAGVITNGIDPSDWMLGATSLAFQDKNDGLVASCSTHLGHVIRDDYHMNHLDEINQMLGLRDLFSTDPVSVFRAQANRLKNLGL